MARSRTRQVIAGLGDEHLFSGWGVRTVAENELRYNPMSYHNGSVWPHDNALLAAGAARYDDKAFALRILNAQFEASHHFDLMRLPELLCGFRRRGREAPLHFPVACSPQSGWATSRRFKSTPRASAYRASKACSASMKAAVPPRD